MLEVGETFERFRIEAVLGQGGMGKVFRAFDTRLERRVALKVLLLDASLGVAARELAIAQMMSEARAAAGIEHPNKVSVYDLGQSEDLPYIAMEYIPGVTLRAYVGQREPTWARKLAWLLAAASALEAAHEAGIVHRDVKPENVMVRDDGVVKVLDFGIARRRQEGADPHRLNALGRTDRIAGTPAYMAPEQLGGVEIDGRADQFAWAITAYELLTGTFPFPSSSSSLAPSAALYNGAPTSLRARVPDLPRLVDETILRALSKHPGDRYPRIGQIVDGLSPLADRRSGTTKRDHILLTPSNLPRARMASGPHIPPTIADSSDAYRPPSLAPKVVSSPLPPAISSSPSAPTSQSAITGTRGFSSEDALDFSVDAEARFARFPPGFVLKGMFFSRLLGIGARHAEGAKAKLKEPPRAGKYLPFGDYPQVDFSRIAHAVATGLHPDLSVPEAMRRLARQDFATFAASAVGRVTLALMGDADTAILKMPDTYSAVMKGGAVTARTITKGEYELSFRDFYGWVDCYPFGQVEGMVRHYGMTCTIDARIDSALNAVYRIKLFRTLYHRTLPPSSLSHLLRGPCSTDPNE